MLYPDVLVAEGECLVPGALEREFRPRHERQMPGDVGRLAPAVSPGAPAPPARDRRPVECAGSEGRLYPPAHLFEVDAESPQCIGVAFAYSLAAPSNHLAEGYTGGVEGDSDSG